MNVPAWMTGSVTIAGADINIYRAVIIVIALIMTAITWFIMYRTSMGMQVRAIMRNPKMAAACGIDVNRVDVADLQAYRGCSRALPGVLMSGFKTVFPDMGTPLVVDGFLVVVVGGVGSLFGSLAASGILGQINGFVAAVSNDILARAVIFAVVIVIIVFKPSGCSRLRGLSRRSLSVLLLDEPTEGIQPNIVEEIEEIILRLNREQGLTSHSGRAEHSVRAQDR